jgi:hypothetical protein
MTPIWQGQTSGSNRRRSVSVRPAKSVQKTNSGQPKADAIDVPDYKINKSAGSSTT